MYVYALPRSRGNRGLAWLLASRGEDRADQTARERRVHVFGRGQASLEQRLARLCPRQALSETSVFIERVAQRLF
jgi:hypothetical protein